MTLPLYAAVKQATLPFWCVVIMRQLLQMTVRLIPHQTSPLDPNTNKHSIYMKPLTIAAFLLLYYCFLGFSNASTNIIKPLILLLDQARFISLSDWAIKLLKRLYEPF